MVFIRCNLVRAGLAGSKGGDVVAKHLVCEPCCAGGVLVARPNALIELERVGVPVEALPTP